MSSVLDLLRTLDLPKSNLAVSMLEQRSMETDDGGVRIFFYDSPEWLELEEKAVRAFNDEGHVYPEDIALYVLLRDRFWQHRVHRPEEADFVFTPFPATTARCIPQDEFNRALGRMSLLGKIPHLLIDTHDAYSRPGYAQGNPSRESLAELKQALFGWISADFTLLYLDSTPQDHPDDIPVLPFCGFETIPPDATERPYSTGFVGTLGQEHWPAGNIRGKEAFQNWMDLKDSFGTDAFIGSNMEAILTLSGITSPLIELPRLSKTWLCPRGFSSYTYRISESVLSGAVPWILADDYRLPFEQLIDWSGFSIRSRESDLPHLKETFVQNRLPIEQKIKKLHDFQHYFTPEGLFQLIRMELKRRRKE
jgi:hypothetical protein